MLSMLLLLAPQALIAERVPKPSKARAQRGPVSARESPRLRLSRGSWGQTGQPTLSDSAERRPERVTTETPSRASGEPVALEVALPQNTCLSFGSGASGSSALR